MSNAVAYWESGEHDVIVSVTGAVIQYGVSANHAFGLVGRLSDLNNYWICACDSGLGALALLEYNAGTTTLRAQTSMGTPGPPVLGLDVDTPFTLTFTGTSITGTCGMTTVNYTSSFNLNETKHGILGHAPYGATYEFDDFLVEC